MAMPTTARRTDLPVAPEHFATRRRHGGPESRRGNARCGLASATIGQRHEHAAAVRRLPLAQVVDLLLYKIVHPVGLGTSPGRTSVFPSASNVFDLEPILGLQ